MNKLVEGDVLYQSNMLSGIIYNAIDLFLF